MPGTLELVGDVEDLRDEREAVADVERRGDDARDSRRRPRPASATGRPARSWWARRWTGRRACSRSTTTGISAMAERPRPSVIRAKPPPEVAHMARTPAWAAPMAMLMTPISSSTWRTMMPALRPCGGHPVQHAGGGAHGIGAVELDAGGRSAHGHGGVAAEHGVALVGHGQRVRERLEVLAWRSRIRRGRWRRSRRRRPRLLAELLAR